MGKLLSAWFGFKAPVGSGFYLKSGLFLMALRYVGETLMTRVALGRWLDPWTFLTPLFGERWRILKEVASSGFPVTDQAWLVPATVLWAAPFVWIGVSMSVRRAQDADLSPWMGTLFLMPLVNYLVILLLVLVPGTKDSRGNAVQPPPAQSRFGHELQSALLAVLFAVLIGVGSTLLNVQLVEEYGINLFLMGPFVMGLVSTWFVHRGGYRGGKTSFTVAILSVLASGGALLLFALEGFICLAMALPIALPFALLGALVGDALCRANRRAKRPVAGVGLALPLLAFIPSLHAPDPPLRAVVSELVIDAAPEQIWPNVIGFSELPPPADWVLRTGIAVPLRARIDGSGVGAVRTCEFSTGPFVEPITTWDPPRYLGFDVASQPPSMQEWSPWEHVHAPHVERSLRSRRGAFELVPMPGGRTLLRGTTWYTLDMAPRIYWARWSDWVIGRIHRRVLRHIKSLSES